MGKLTDQERKWFEKLWTFPDGTELWRARNKDDYAAYVAGYENGIRLHDAGFDSYDSIVLTLALLENWLCTAKNIKDFSYKIIRTIYSNSDTHQPKAAIFEYIKQECDKLGDLHLQADGKDIDIITVQKSFSCLYCFMCFEWCHLVKKGNKKDFSPIGPNYTFCGLHYLFHTCNIQECKDMRDLQEHVKYAVHRGDLNEKKVKEYLSLYGIDFVYYEGKKPETPHYFIQQKLSF